MFFKVIYYVLFIITFAYGIYFVITVVIGLIKKRKNNEIKSDIENYFAILIAARNEEGTIGNLLDSLNELNYSKEKYRVYVIPNNCTDQTEKISLEHKANIINCNVKTKTKADVLRFAFNHLQDKKEIDAYIIFDADNVVDKNFLIYMNKSLNSGYRVAEGFRDAKNPYDNWISGSYTIFYLYQNVFFNHARKNMNLSASINGTGFMIKKELIDTEGFNTKTLTEDVEFTGICALKKEKIDFVEDAITYDEYPINFKSSWKQRKRWTAGNLNCMKLYSFKLFIDYLKTGNYSSLDMALVYLAPIMQILNFVNMILLILFKYVGIELNDIFSYYYASGFICFIISYLIGIITELFVLKYKGKSIKSLISGIVLFSFFIFTWIPINIICLIKKQTNWEEIKHNRNVTINEIKN